MMRARTKKKLKEELENLDMPGIPISETVSIDPEGFAQAGCEDCEERVFTLDGKEVTHGGTAE